MASHKSQHYVPKCYLRKFSKYETRRQINLLILENLKTVKAASLKHQCAKNYFYSSDKEVENLLSHYEKNYSKITDWLEDNFKRVEDHHLHILREFAFLQYMRTEGVRARLAKGIENLKSFATKEELEHFDSSISMLSLKTFYDLKETFLNLRCAIIKNRTPQGFITSDDPALIINKFVHQKYEKYGGCGINNAGVVLIYPLTPTLMIIVYDNDIYNITSLTKNFLSIDKIEDVHRLNSLQILNANKTVFFSKWENREDLVSHCQSLVDLRNIPRVQNYYGLEDDEEAEAETKRVKIVSQEEAENADSKNIGVYHFSHERGIVPKRWPSLLRFRLRPKFHNSHSAAGLVRLNENFYHTNN